MKGEKQMADIMTVRDFTRNLRSIAKAGNQVVVVDGVKKKIIATLTFNEIPTSIEHNIRVIFSR
jgi:hypothetical protein